MVSPKCDWIHLVPSDSHCKLFSTWIGSLEEDGNTDESFNLPISKLDVSAFHLPVIYDLLSYVEDGALHISSVQYSDAGEYYCTAENRAGRHQRRTILSVTGMTTLFHCYFFFNGRVTNTLYSWKYILSYYHSVCGVLSWDIFTLRFKFCK